MLLHAGCRTAAPLALLAIVGNDAHLIELPEGQDCTAGRLLQIIERTLGVEDPQRTHAARYEKLIRICLSKLRRLLRDGKVLQPDTAPISEFQLLNNVQQPFSLSKTVHYAPSFDSVCPILPFLALRSLC